MNVTAPYTFTKPIIELESYIIQKKIDLLNLIEQPEQRTPEWYWFRYNLITASNGYKAYESQALQNALIYEKCKPPLIMSENSYVNVESPLHWGQKYEPLSALLYEKEYDVKLGEFGCIKHPKYYFLGASPDGIIVNKLNTSGINDRFGRMLEIKNVVSREINGIPKKEYWIQMQLQMETCDLDECDFLETRFKEIEEDEYEENLANLKLNIRATDSRIIYD